MPISPGYAAPTLARFADSFNFVCAADVQPISIAYTLSLWPVLEDEGQQSASNLPFIRLLSCHLRLFCTVITGHKRTFSAM